MSIRVVDEDEWQSILATIVRAKQQRAEDMPTIKDALKQIADAVRRLEDIGFRNAIYCPKDGSLFDAVDAGCTELLTCHYMGEWPDGSCWYHEADDLWPASPIMFRARVTGEEDAA